MFRAMNAVMAGLFALAVAVQYNDPDPLRWMLVYGAAMVVTIVALLRGSVPPAVPAFVALVAITWAVFASRGGSGFESYAHMFESWEMKNEQVEQARETSGLLIVVGWMLTLSVRSMLMRRAAGER